MTNKTKLYTKIAAYSVTICESGENHTGMEIIGEKADAGFTCDELKEIKKVFDKGRKKYGVKTEYLDLKE